MDNTVFIFHGTEGHPQECWFPWLKGEFEERGYRVFVPQFPSPPNVAAKIEEWFEVFKNYEQYVDSNTILIGHSLGGIFALKLMERLSTKIKAAFFVGTPIGVKPVLYYEKDLAFCGYRFDWEKIRGGANYFGVFQSDNDPFVGLENGVKLAEHLGVDLTFIPNAGHFNNGAGCFELPRLRDMVLGIGRDGLCEGVI